MSHEGRTFATLDLCPQCGGIFVDAGEGVTALGHRYDLGTLARAGQAEMVGVSAIECPSDHGKMMVYRVRSAAEAVEVDFCATCAGVFFDAGEADVFRDIAAHSGEVVTHTGARFSAPPSVAADVAQQQLREERGGSAFASFFEDVAKRYAEGRRRRRGMF